MAGGGISRPMAAKVCVCFYASEAFFKHRIWLSNYSLIRCFVFFFYFTKSIYLGWTHLGFKSLSNNRLNCTFEWFDVKRKASLHLHYVLPNIGISQSHKLWAQGGTKMFVWVRVSLIFELFRGEKTETSSLKLYHDVIYKCCPQDGSISPCV